MKTGRVVIDGHPDVILTRERLVFEVDAQGALHAADGSGSYFVAAPGRWVSATVQPTETTPTGTR